MRALIIGYGSIGSRHSRLLAERGHEVRAVSRNESCPYTRYASVKEACDDYAPELVVVANKTVDHLETLEQLQAADFAGRVLVEKPLFNALPVDFTPGFQSINTAYNLRFHPMLRDAFDLIQGREIYSAQLYVGSYLPGWRPGTDYSQCYSAHRAQGGGVLRDLSHELDTAMWLLGDWKGVVARGGHVSSLDIDSDDVYVMLLETESCPMVTIQCNYLDRQPRREFIINSDELSIKGDMISGRMEVNGETSQYDLEPDHTYAAQIDAATGAGDEHFCTFEQGMRVMALIQGAEQSVENRGWVYNS